MIIVGDLKRQLDIIAEELVWLVLECSDKKESKQLGIEERLISVLKMSEPALFCFVLSQAEKLINLVALEKPKLFYKRLKVFVGLSYSVYRIA